MKVPLMTGAYSAKSLVAEAQRCVNLYAETNPKDATFPYTYYLTPGLTLKAAAEDLSWRGLYFASNNVGYGVCGASLYRVNSDFSLVKLGEISTTQGPVNLVDNSEYLVVVDGSTLGYQVKLDDNTMSPLPAGYAGSDTVNYLDGFLVCNLPGTREWFISLANQVSFDPSDFTTKSGYSDLLAGVAVTKRYIYLLGEQTTEVWFNTGGTTFPFSRMPGVFMQYGCAAPASIAQMDGEVYWLSQTPQGVAIVCRSSQFNALQISTFALDNELASYGDISDAIGFTYQIEGHFFYVLTFPTANKTWQYDLSTEQWNELNWVDENGNLNRHRANCYASLYGLPVVGDWENGNLYLWDVNAYTDNGSPIARIRSFAHAADDNSSRIRYREFIANLEVGNGADGQPVPVFLRWSDTRGRSWGNQIQASLGMEGEYIKSVQFQRLGMARDRVFELSWSAPAKTALLGAWVQAESNNQ